MQSKQLDKKPTELKPLEHYSKESATQVGRILAQQTNIRYREKVRRQNPDVYRRYEYQANLNWVEIYLSYCSTRARLGASVANPNLWGKMRIGLEQGVSGRELMGLLGKGKSETQRVLRILRAHNFAYGLIFACDKFGKSLLEYLAEQAEDEIELLTDIYNGYVLRHRESAPYFKLELAIRCKQSNQIPRLADDFFRAEYAKNEELMILYYAAKTGDVDIFSDLFNRAARNDRQQEITLVNILLNQPRNDQDAFVLQAVKKMPGSQAVMDKLFEILHNRYRAFEGGLTKEHVSLLSKAKQDAIKAAIYFNQPTALAALVVDELVDEVKKHLAYAIDFGDEAVLEVLLKKLTRFTDDLPFSVIAAGKIEIARLLAWYGAKINLRQDNLSSYLLFLQRAYNDCRSVELCYLQAKLLNPSLRLENYFLYLLTEMILNRPHENTAEQAKYFAGEYITHAKTRQLAANQHFEIWARMVQLDRLALCKRFASLGLDVNAQSTTTKKTVLHLCLERALTEINAADFSLLQKRKAELHALIQLGACIDIPDQAGVTCEAYLQQVIEAISITTATANQQAIRQMENASKKYVEMMGPGGPMAFLLDLPAMALSFGGSVALVAGITAFTYSFIYFRATGKFAFNNLNRAIHQREIMSAYQQASRSEPLMLTNGNDNAALPLSSSAQVHMVLGASNESGRVESIITMHDGFSELEIIEDYDPHSSLVAPAETVAALAVIVEPVETTTAGLNICKVS